MPKTNKSKVIYEFNKEKHEHKLNGIIVPGPTTILKDLCFIDLDFVKDEHLYRGNYVHAACHLYNQGILDEASIKEEFAGYIEGYKKAYKLLNLKVRYSEMPVYSQTWQTAGIPDIITEEDYYIWDIKTSKKQAGYWKIQTAAYACMFNEMFAPLKSKGRGVIQLFDNGNYEIIDHKEEKADVKAWLQVVSVYRLKKLYK